MRQSLGLFEILIISSIYLSGLLINNTIRVQITTETIINQTLLIYLLTELWISRPFVTGNRMVETNKKQKQHSLCSHKKGKKKT